MSLYLNQPLLLTVCVYLFYYITGPRGSTWCINDCGLHRSVQSKAWRSEGGCSFLLSSLSSNGYHSIVSVDYILLLYLLKQDYLQTLRRLAQNREAARKSRLRKKVMYSPLSNLIEIYLDHPVIFGTSYP